MMPQLRQIDKEELEKLELLLNLLEHPVNCPYNQTRALCECGLSEGRRRLYNYIKNCRTELENGKTN
jgi:hypothetical protein